MVPVRPIFSREEYADAERLLLKLHRNVPVNRRRLLGLLNWRAARLDRAIAILSHYGLIAITDRSTEARLMKGASRWLYAPIIGEPMHGPPTVEEAGI